jgi:hypothetical protein
MTLETMTASAPEELRRELGLASATAVVAGECIAVGQSLGEKEHSLVEVD